MLHTSDANRLLVIGSLDSRSKVPPMSSAVPIDAVVDVVRSSAKSGVIRCGSPGDLVRGVATYMAKQDKLLDVLDLYFHAAPGLQAMGDGILFSSDLDPKSPLVGLAIATALRAYLSPTAHVRLLGCMTARDDVVHSGRLLLIKLAEALGDNRIVFGTDDSIVPQAFDETGFATIQNARFLFSSLAALDVACPDSVTRIKSYQQLH